MLSIKPLQSAKAACDYYLQALEYYQSDATAVQWLGSGMKYLKLENNIDNKLFLNLLQGQMPNGQKLQNPQGEHRPGFDMTFSAPKSVSVLVGLEVAPELITFHDNAVKYAISQIEKEFAEVRVRHNGEVNYVKTDNLLVASFRQPSSRSNDPALHTHCVTLNMTFLDGKARSLASDKLRKFGVVEQIQNNAHYCGLLYLHHLANSLKDAGFNLKLTGDGLFEIEGVPDDILKEFSKRRVDIENLMSEKGWSGAKSAAAATLITRQGKEEHDLKRLQSNWQERAQTLGFDAKEFIENRNQHKSENLFSKLRDELASFIEKYKKPSSNSNNPEAKACVQVAIETLSQKTSVFTERALFAESLKHSLIYDKSISPQTIRDEIQQEKTINNLYTAICPETKQTLLTTPWLLTLEVETIERIENNKELVSSIATLNEIKSFQKRRAPSLLYQLTALQKEAMTALLTSKDRFIAIQGYAGSAKTTMLSEVRLLMEDKGYEIRGIAVASAAANELNLKAQIQSDVFPIIHQELKNAKTGMLDKRVYIVDEASMLSSPEGHSLMKQIERTQARLILVGDRAQLPSVRNGRIFGLIQDHGIKTAIMDDIVRQKNQDLKEAVISATKGNVFDAIQKLDIKELSTHQERIEWIADNWFNLSKQNRDETLLFAPTHKDRLAITAIIRDKLKQEGTLQGSSYMQTILKVKPMEAVQQRFIAYYNKDDVIRFNQDFKKQTIQHGKYYTVGQILAKHRQKNILPLINKKNKTILFPLKDLPKYKTHTAAFERVIEVYKRQTLELCIGDKVMWSRNFKADDIRNGETLLVKDIKDNNLTFTTKDGKKLIYPKNHPALQHLDYSYVLTNYKVQGKDATYGIGLMESYNSFSATMKNFYVQISRATTGMKLVTDNKEQLIHAIKNNNDEKQAALDVILIPQLEKHNELFKVKTNLSTQSSIDKKAHFEKTHFQKNTEYVKELEL
ncbi:MAG: MobF family relaxase [Legionellaceae bacterium]|nr:MobF family relaxase [Legionellaceae bacterium]